MSSLARERFMAVFTSNTIQQIRGLIILGGLTFLAIPCALILSGVAFVAIIVILELCFAGIVWKRLHWIRIKISKSKLKRGVQIW